MGHKRVDLMVQERIQSVRLSQAHGRLPRVQRAPERGDGHEDVRGRRVD